MQFFKTLEGMFSHQFEQDGMVDDKGNPIKATEQPLKGKELKKEQEKYITHRIIQAENLLTPSIHTDKK